MTRGASIAIGIAVLANALALGGVAYNRSEVVERVVLRDTEFTPTYGTFNAGSNAIVLSWLSGTDLATPAFTETQLRAAGLDLPPVEGPNPMSLRFPPRKVAVALELDGPSRKLWLDHFFEHAQPNSTPPETRLAAVDIGRDVATLRAAHPDPSRFLVLNAIVHPNVTYGVASRPVWSAYVTSLLPSEIHVPRDMRDALESNRDRDGRARYAVTLAVGRRGEVWIEKTGAR